MPCVSPTTARQCDEKLQHAENTWAISCTGSCIMSVSMPAPPLSKCACKGLAVGSNLS